MLNLMPCLNKAVSMGIDYVATGHYAKIEYDEIQKKIFIKEICNR